MPNTIRDKRGTRIMLKKILMSSLVLLGLTAWSSSSHAHCQVPCGIYRDHARVLQMQEDLRTIRKAVDQIAQLAAKQDVQSKNQLVRWINTKEHHAEQIMRTIADYFMAQKITPRAATQKKQHAAYLERLMRHHQVMVAAMKCKQSSDRKAVKGLERTLNAITKYWRHNN